MYQESPTVTKTITNPFESMPATPLMGSRVNNETSRRVMDNLEILCVPSVMSSADGRTSKIQMRSANPRMMNAALQRMRQGDALERLRKLQEEPHATKSPSNAVFGLRQPPHRSESIARSA